MSERIVHEYKSVMCFLGGGALKSTLLESIKCQIVYVKLGIRIEQPYLQLTSRDCRGFDG